MPNKHSRNNSSIFPRVLRGQENLLTSTRRVGFRKVPLLLLLVLYPISTADVLLLLRPLIRRRRMGLTTPPAACLGTRPARCCRG